MALACGCRRRGGARARPRRYPGDYEAQILFEGMLTGCATQPQFETPRCSWGPVAKRIRAANAISAGRPAW